ncbi:MAG: right-handed parallel beta-helix repeat-containing protein [Coleofasciculus chthonoplastes F3-SA18-01]|uniref:right-handed parallel beta-helix repeat-containing protein n=1 Tax=Coleofasciculus chthonoplastes TaxID=64178 RepID=UPI0032F8ABF0
MKNTKLGLISVFLLSISSPPVLAQTEAASETADNLRIKPRLGIGHTSSGGGFDGFTRLEGFVPLLQTPGKNLTFLEGRLFLDNDDANLGGNLLLGYRTYSANSDRIWGGYMSYDNRHTGHNTFNQLGLGIESLGTVWDFRVNGYLPIGDTRQGIGDAGVRDIFFRRNFLILEQGQNKEAAMGGWDAEVGAKLAQIGTDGDLRGYGGLYWYDAEGTSEIWGWRVRLEAHPSDNFNLGLSLQNDDLFGTNLVFTVGATFPGSRPQGLTDEDDRVLARFAESVQRTNAIVIDHQDDFQDVPATNPETGEPYVFQHVVLGEIGGDGTFENPFGIVENGLDQTVSDGNDIVYVQPGSNPGIPPFTIPDRVQVLSTGPIQQLDTVETGIVQLPLSGAGILPTITPGAAASVTLGNRTTLSGFYIPDAGTFGIEGREIDTVTIRDNAIANSTQAGIVLLETTGNVTVTDNSIDTTGGLGNSGFFIGNTAGLIDLNLVRNQIVNTTGDGMGIVLFNAEDSTVTLSENILTDNLLNGIGFRLANAVNVNFNINDNTSQNNGSAGLVSELVNNSNSSVTIINNEISDNQFDGIAMALADNSEGIVTMTNNNLRGNQEDGIVIGLFADSDEIVTIVDNTLSENQFNGIDVLLSDNSQGTVNVTNNTILNNQFDGIIFTFLDDSRGRVTIVENTLARNQRRGMTVQSTMTAEGEVLIQNNLISDNETLGIAGLMIGDSSLGVTIDNNEIFNNGYHGIGVSIQEAATLRLEITDNRVDRNGFQGVDLNFPQPDGIFIDALNNSTLQLLLERNTVMDNARFGAFILAEDQSELFAGVRFNTFTGNPGTLDNANGFVVQTGSLTNLEPESTICLDLSNNTSENGFSLNYTDLDSTFKADTTANNGTISIPQLPVEPLGDCPVP